MQGWRAYYEDGGIYTSAEMVWTELPPLGVVGVIEYEDKQYEPGLHYRRMVCGGDYYWIEDNEWKIVPTCPTWGKWADPPDVPFYIKSGALPDDEYEALRWKMMDERKAP